MENKSKYNIVLLVIMMLVVISLAFIYFYNAKQTEQFAIVEQGYLSKMMPAESVEIDTVLFSLSSYEYLGLLRDELPVLKISFESLFCEEEVVGIPDFPIVTKLKNINGRTYCVSDEYTGGGMGHTGHEYSYSAVVGDQLKTLSFSLVYSTCSFYEENGDDQEKKCQDERENFNLDQIVDSYFRDLEKK